MIYVGLFLLGAAFGPFGAVILSDRSHIGIGYFMLAFAILGIIFLMLGLVRA